MKRTMELITQATRSMDRIAGWILMLAVFLIVVNILSRQLFRSSILGTYEYVGYLTAAVIALSVAYCAVQNAHIAVGFIVERFPVKMQSMIDIFTRFISLVFFGLVAWHMARYAWVTALSGELSPTTRLPFYPFIYLTALGLLALCAVILAQLLATLKKVMGK